MPDAELDRILSPEAMTSPGVPGHEERKFAAVHPERSWTTRRSRSALVLAPAQSRSQQRQQHGKLFPPEDLPELEGPDRDDWQRPDQIMDALDIAEGSVVADLGAGSGWFTIRLARARRPERQGLRRGHPAADDRGHQAPRAARELQRQDRNQCSAPRRIPGCQPVPLDAVLIVDAYHEMEQSRRAAPQCREVAQAGGPPRHRRVHEDRRRPGPGHGRARGSGTGDS